jgi:endo-1,4-beta-xylanase
VKGLAPLRQRGGVKKDLKMILILMLSAVLLLNAVVTEAGLRDIAAQHDLTYGCAAGFRALASDASFRAAVSRECGTLTPTTALKMAKVAIAPGVYDFRQSDWVVAYAQAHGITVRGHTLVWYKEIPAWVTRLSPAETRQFLKSHITRVMSRYPSITSWDVVNEPVTSTGLQNNLWLQKLGPQYIDLAFRVAAQVRPGTQLVLNEYGIELPGQRAKRARILEVLRGLVARGVPVKALGIQAHLAQSGHIDTALLVGFVRQVRALGLDVLITELDVRGSNDEQVARVCREVLQAALAAGVKHISTWGLSDRYKSPELAGYRPLPLDANLQAKPTYQALAEVLQQGPSTSVASEGSRSSTPERNGERNSSLSEIIGRTQQTGFPYSASRSLNEKRFTHKTTSRLLRPSP